MSVKPTMKIGILSLSLLLSFGCATKNPAAEPQAEHPEIERIIRFVAEKGDWEAAAKLCRANLNSGHGNRSLAENGLRLAMVSWNKGDKIGAIIAMDSVVATSANFGEETERLALLFRNAFRTGAVPKKFTVEEVTENVGMRRALSNAIKAYLTL